MLGKLARLKCKYEVIHGVSADVGKFSLQAGVQTVTEGQCGGHGHRKGMALVVKRTCEGFLEDFVSRLHLQSFSCFLANKRVCGKH